MDCLVTLELVSSGQVENAQGEMMDRWHGRVQVAT